MNKQQYLMDQKKDSHARKRIQWEYNPSDNSFQIISIILHQAREAGKEGAVSQYIVGAKLQLRYPEIEISNDSYSTADVQLGRHGDFYIGNTVFHITVSPTPAVFDKCRHNIEQGQLVCLLVPERLVIAATQLLGDYLTDKVIVSSIEAFVSQNINELGTFLKENIINNIRELLQIYNRRVDAVENDKSMLIEIPSRL